MTLSNYDLNYLRVDLFISIMRKKNSQYVTTAVYLSLKYLYIPYSTTEHLQVLELTGLTGRD